MIKTTVKSVNLPNTVKKCDWTNEEIETLKRIHKQFTAEQIATLLNRTHAAVARRKTILGLTDTKNPDWTKEEIAKLKKMYHRGDSVMDISSVLNRNVTSIRIRLHKEGIKRK